MLAANSSCDWVKGPDGVTEGWLQPQAKPLSGVLSMSLFQIQVEVEVLVRKSCVV
jgi:hypothetical protein